MNDKVAGYASKRDIVGEASKLCDEHFMRRCLQLARCGQHLAKPNPMVGAVIVDADACIIGEGFHICCGHAHAEVNAFAALSPLTSHPSPPTPHLSPLTPHPSPLTTLYVSLEPCSHYGKTPPCADLIISKGVGRVVVGCIDEFAEVQGRGIKKLRDAGIDVTVGVLEDECKALNRRFFTFHRLHRPYIILKWAQTANGFIDDHGHALPISTPFTQMLCHKLRAEEDAILVGRVTDEREHPQLTVRHWVGDSPRRFVLSHRQPLSMQSLYEQNIQSLIVEGGAQTLNAFLSQGLWDELRIETAHNITVTDGTRAPQIPAIARVTDSQTYGHNTIIRYAPSEIHYDNAR